MYDLRRDRLKRRSLQLAVQGWIALHPEGDRAFEHLQRTPGTCRHPVPATQTRWECLLVKGASRTHHDQARRRLGPVAKSAVKL